MMAIQATKWRVTGESLFLSRSRRGVPPPLSFIDSDGVRYYDQEWRSKATDIVEGRRENVN